MRTSLDCLPCLVRQALDAGKLASPDPALSERLVRDTLAGLAESDLRQSPPMLAQRVHRRLRELTGRDDIYRPAKERLNRVALDLREELETALAKAADPFDLAVRLAIAGNVIDMGVTGAVSESDVRRSVEQALRTPVRGWVDELRRSVRHSDRILYLADNAGELVFDRLLIERLGPDRVTVAMRGAPVLNDATMEDARTAGLTGIVEVIDNGSDAPGTVLDDCSPTFRQRFSEADLIIAKGQGNFETLVDEPAPIYFLFKVKCPVIAARVGLPMGTHVVARSGAPLPDPGVGVPLSTDPGRPAQPSLADDAGLGDQELPVVAYRPIGVIHSEHRDARDAPAQPALAKGCRGTAVILPEYERGLQDLEGFSHVCLICHLDRAAPPRLMLRPRRHRVERGVFATRAPSRPNPIGLSTVELLGREGNILYLDGLDLLDGTPLLDIKPYIARFDRITDARNGWQDEPGDAPNAPR
ncbi:MAG: tRNA (N6-threonylcarbamoyladenosine(37)-N6)-methyltransferase TrmO [Candidatus Limnocylindrales bacterium]